MWNAAPIIFEDEDEEQLKADFVTFSARYPDRDPFEIAAYIFRNQRDPELRAQQAAMIWLKDLDVIERIRFARLNGGNEVQIESKEQKLVKLQAIYSDDSRPVKERIDAMRLHSELQGEIVKAIDKKVDNTGKPRRQIVFAQYDD